MGANTAIAWTDHTLNPWMGCFKVSQGCKLCYAEVLTVKRMRLDVWGPDTNKRKKTSPTTWNQARKWNAVAKEQRNPHRVFCASLADVFEDSPQTNKWRIELWDLVRHTPWLDWQMLTKRPENIARMLPSAWDQNQWGYWPNVWLGTSIEDNRVADRAEALTQSNAITHFISYEPAIGSASEVSLDHIDWVICGGESGPGYRRMDLGWAYDMWSRCIRAKIPFFFKQDAAPRTEMGIDALGQIVREYPQGWDRRW